MKPVRLYGDPFGSGAAAAALRACLARCRQRGFTASLCLSAVRPGGAVAAGGQVLELGDGARTFTVATELPLEVVALLRAAAAVPVPATAPVVVFAPRRWRQDLLALAGLEWSSACAVLPGDGGADEWRADDWRAVDAVLDEVAHELEQAGLEDPPLGGDRDELAPFAVLPAPAADGPVLHVGGDFDAGGDVAVRAFAQMADGPRRLRVVGRPGAAGVRDAAALRELLRQLGGDAAAARLEVVPGPLLPEHVRDCAAVLQPLRRLVDGSLLARLLASGRPVVATRFHATAAALGAPGTCVPIGGALLRGDDGAPWCEPDLANVVEGLRLALAGDRRAQDLGRRGRDHAAVQLTGPRPARPPRAPAVLPYPPARPAAGPRRPVVVLEAPWLETSSASELSIETARGLLRRGRVDLRLWPVPPFRQDLDALRRRAPELVPLLTRDPGPADLWLATGWPPRTDRPRCAAFAVRLDWEYGVLPTELSPLVTQEADAIVVHSRHVERTVAAAGCAPARIVRVPHGVDAARFHENAPADPELLAWKGDRPAVLFVGGMVFRKGFDVFLRAALAATARGARFALVVKAIGSDQHYAGFHLGELAQRFAATPGAPPLRVLGDDLPREQLPALYRACDLLFHPYRGEGFGMPALEARACGLPALLTRGGACDDFAPGTDTGEHGVVALPAARRALDLPGAFPGQPWVLEPNAQLAGDLLARCLSELPRLRQAARTNASAVRAAHTWDAAAAAIERLIPAPGILLPQPQQAASPPLAAPPLLR
ncbi:MAG: glycosyltransferase [Planctomycetota bacterium]